jgi:hypothetical protein
MLAQKIALEPDEMAALKVANVERVSREAMEIRRILPFLGPPLAAALPQSFSVLAPRAPTTAKQMVESSAGYA